MTGKQKSEAASFLAGWQYKVNVGCLVVGLFQPAHMLGGIIGSVLCFLAGIILKVMVAK